MTKNYCHVLYYRILWSNNTCILCGGKRKKRIVGEQKVEMFMYVYKESIVLKIKSKSCLLCKGKKRKKVKKKEKKEK